MGCIIGTFLKQASSLSEEMKKATVLECCTHTVSWEENERLGLRLAHTTSFILSCVECNHRSAAQSLGRFVSGEHPRGAPASELSSLVYTLTWKRAEALWPSDRSNCQSLAVDTPYWAATNLIIR